MPIEINLKAIGERIEKLRGRLSQAEFAATLAVDRKTVGTWERGERLPDTKALIALWGAFDSDPAWVLTGSGYIPTGSDDERELLALFRAAPLAVKAAAIGALQGGNNPAAMNHQSVMGGTGQQFNAPVSGGVAGRNVIQRGGKKEK